MKVILSIAGLFFLSFLISHLKLSLYSDLWLEKKLTQIFHPYFKSDEYLKDVVIVRIDNESLRQIGIKWPWPRAMFATVVENLAKANPRLLVLNINQSGASPFGERDDEALGRALLELPNVIMSCYLTAEGRVVRPYEEYQEKIIGSGFINVPRGEGGINHSYWPFALNSKGQISVASITFETFLALEKLSIDQLRYDSSDERLVFPDQSKWPVPPDLEIYLKYRYHPKYFKKISFHDVYQGRFSPVEIQDKIVLLGNDSPIFHEILETPMGSMSGIYVIANQLAQLLNRDFLHIWPGWISIILTAFLASLGGFFILRYKLFAGLTFFTGFVLLYVIGIAVGFIFNQVWSYSMPLYAMVVLFVSINFFKLAVLFKKGAFLRRMAIHDFLTGAYTFRYLRIHLEQNIHSNLEHRQDAALFLFDIIDFRSLNESKGRETADKILMAFADKLKNLAPKRGVIARYRGGQFVMLMNGIKDENASLLAHKIYNDLNGIEYGFGSSNIILNLTIVYSTLLGGDFKSAQIFLKSVEKVLSRAHKSVPRTGIFNFEESDMSPSERSELSFMKSHSKDDMGYIEMDLELREQELFYLKQDLEKIYQQRLRVEKLAAAGELSAKFYHEFGHPIMNIQLGLEILRSRLKELPESLEIVQTMHSEAERMSRLCHKMLGFFRTKSDFQTLKLLDILEDVVSLMKPKFQSHGIEIVKNYNGNNPVIQGSSDELIQVFINLILNAIDAMPQGGKLVLGCHIDRDSHTILANVEDSGMGIPEENKEKVFDIFFTTKGERGTGLGLPTCYNIIRRHGGNIQIESESGKGTNVIIKLPIAPENEVRQNPG